jgi:hypothetical protein
MENIGHIEIRVSGFSGNMKLNPDNFDIKELMTLIEQAEKMLFPVERKGRPVISYKIEEGSVRNIFKTSQQAIIGFSALLRQICALQNIDFLELNTAKAFETFQEAAVKKNYAFEIKTSLPDSTRLKIDSSTSYYRTKEHWAEAEFYFYGKITNAGGKERANIHLFTEEYGNLIIQTSWRFLADKKENILYKTFGVRAKGRQNTETGEIDKSSLLFVELIDYNNQYDEKYLKAIRNKAKAWINNIDPDDWINEIRGYNA